MIKKIKQLYLALILATVSVGLQSCGEEPPYTDDDYYWFAGRAFSAYAQPGSYNTYWRLEFYGNGTFTAVPLDYYGDIIFSMTSYRGTYSIDYKQGRLFMSFQGYSMISMWWFEWYDEVDEYTGTYPYMEIFSSEGSGALDNLTFYPDF